VQLGPLPKSTINAGKTWVELATERITQPLGLKSPSSSGDPKDINANEVISELDGLLQKFVNNGLVTPPRHRPSKALAKIEQSFTDGIANIFTDPRIV